MPKWRKMTWVLVIWCVLILAWAIGGASSAQDECGSSQLAQDACDAGTGIGVAIILFIGFIGFVFLSLIWFMSRPSGRECPACGERAKKGQIRCENCGHSFAAAAQGSPPPPAQVPAGWYPDAEQPGQQRYWDGNAWTDHRSPAGSTE